LRGKENHSLPILDKKGGSGGGKKKGFSASGKNKKGHMEELGGPNARKKDTIGEKYVLGEEEEKKKKTLFSTVGTVLPKGEPRGGRDSVAEGKKTF